MNTPIWNWPTWPEGITQANQVYNDMLAAQDMQVGTRVLSRTTDAQPGSPSEGDAYIMTAGRSGAAWAGYDLNDIAFYIAGAWTAFAPAAAIRCWVVDDQQLVAWDGSAFFVVTGSITKYPGQNLQTGVAYTLVIGDAGLIVDMNNALDNELMIPSNASVPFPVNTRIDVSQGGAGLTSLAITDDTLQGNVNSAGIYAAMSLWKLSATVWRAWGGVA